LCKKNYRKLCPLVESASLREIQSWAGFWLCLCSSPGCPKMYPKISSPFVYFARVRSNVSQITFILRAKQQKLAFLLTLHTYICTYICVIIIKIIFILFPIRKSMCVHVWIHLTPVTEVLNYHLDVIIVRNGFRCAYVHMYIHMYTSHAFPSTELDYEGKVFSYE
jgi:hypothetical protein